MKIICLDYDGTYTSFPEIMEYIIQYGAKHNIKVILATMRHEEEADFGLKEIANRIDVFYTGRKAKAVYLANLGIKPDVWIDDNPKWLFEDSR